MLRSLRNAAAVVALALTGGSAYAGQDLLWNWPSQTIATTPSGYIPGQFITDANASSPSVLNELAAQQAANPGKVSIKTQGPLSPATINSLFNNPNFTINYVFMDIETPTYVSDAQAQANLIHGTTKGAAARVGNFRLFPGTGDNSGIGAGPSTAQYQSGGPLGVNMANPDLYPGSPYYKDPAQVSGSSTSPNIRSSLFTLPIKRLSYVSSNLPAGSINVPYIDRFNNVGNAELQNGTVLNNGQNQAAFYADAAHGTANQMLSRGDFKAMVMHYRLRGADGVHLLDGGVMGYTQAQFTSDAKEGWNGNTAINNIFNAPDAKVATLNTTIKVNGVKKDFETAGIVYSGVYSDTTGLAGSLHKLALLVSNMTDSPATVSFPAFIGNKSVPDVNINATEHLLLQYTASGSQWVLDTSAPNGGITALFTSAAEIDRNGVGVPEPVAVSTISLIAVGALFRRSRRA